ncbi:MAG TPA: hypothetical protein PL033_07175 [Candidatus Brocadiia bacterium]|nr:hypothetical protein [Candidatus Brocadiia bacterium]
MRHAGAYAMLTFPLIIIGCSKSTISDLQDITPQSGIKMQILIDWKQEQEFPWVCNGGTIGRIDNYVIYATGFGREVPDELKNIPGYHDGYHRMLALFHIPTKEWTLTRPLFPGIARAYGAYSAGDGRSVFILGGQSYAEPFCFRDAYRLFQVEGAWKWERLPDMLFDTAEFGCAPADDRLYVMGGANYAKDGLRAGWDSEYQGVGRHLEALDLSDAGKGWEQLPELPGTHRSHHAMEAIRRRLYVFGGVACRGGDKPEAWNCADNWRYDPDSRQWTRIRDLPFPCGGWSSLAYQDRYVLLFGGYCGRQVLNPDGATRPRYGCDSEGFSNRVIVYDTETNLFSEATPMPKAINDTRMVWLDDNTMMNVTGEIPGSKRIPCVFRGRIKSAGAD